MEEATVTISDTEISLEEQYPQLDRTHKGFKLLGFEAKSGVPVWRKVNWDIGKRYTSAMLRQLRSERGVGNVKRINKQI